MKYTIVLSDAARRDVLDSRDFYTKISPLLSAKFLAELDETFAEVAKNPFQFPVRYRQIRIALTANFPFGIHFLIAEKTIKVLRVLHTKRFYR